MPITPLPTPVPNRGMSEEDFANAGDNFLGALPTFATELNTLQTDVTNKQTTASTAATTATTQATNASASATSASTSATTASNWAIKTGSVVSGSDWSAKEHAVGTSVTTGSAKDWATKTGGLVASTDYSAKYYAQAAQTAAAAAGSAAGLPSLTGNAGKILSVNALATGVEWTSSAGVPIGDTLTTANVLSAPAWLPCNGAVYLKSSYSSLATKLGSLQAAASHTVTFASANSAGMNAVTGIAYGNGLWLAWGTNNAGKNAVTTSTNGTTWTTPTDISGLLGASVRINSITYGGGVFVLVGEGYAGSAGTVCATSTNGTAWTARTIPTGAYRSVAYGGGNFMAVGHASSNGTAYAASSPDGIAWTARSIATQPWTQVAYQGGYFFAVAVGSATAGAMATGASNFSSISMPAGSYTGIASSGSRFVAIRSGSNAFAYSDDNGSTWQDVTVPATQDYSAIAFGDNGAGWLVILNADYMLASSDGISWRKVAIGQIGASSVLGIAYGAGKFLMAKYSSNTTFNINPYGYDTATSFATPITTPSPVSGGLTTYIKAT